MKTFREFVRINGNLITEEIHSELQNILDTPDDDTSMGRSLYDRTSLKLSTFTKKARDLIKNGIDTGLENDKPKKGSSRAVFFSKRSYSNDN